MSHGFSRIFTDQSHFNGIDLLVMKSPLASLKHAELTDKIIGVFYDVYNELGHGFWNRPMKRPSRWLWRNQR
jgi:hypothetical protein